MGVEPRDAPPRRPLPALSPHSRTPRRIPEEGRMAGYRNDKDQLLRRLRRVEGQIRGLQRMVDTDTYCLDTLTQVSAATKALQSVALHLLDSHLAHCVQDAIAGGGAEADAKVAEASQAIARLMRA
ncbi:metal-sensitive transcriptional regulator [Kitasatospora sp. NPDC056651]|uniref:metal-sensitive transcriptional regulator n=1 Tax=Kitasatospora sp. NPDC056651 TaxID=3345892 RepID=UPI0036953F99